MAASFYNGENGIDNITNLFNKGKEKVTQKAAPLPVAPPKVVDQEKEESYEIQRLKKQMDDLYIENQQLKRKVDNLEAQLQKAQ